MSAKFETPEIPMQCLVCDCQGLVRAVTNAEFYLKRTYQCENEHLWETYELPKELVEGFVQTIERQREKVRLR